MDFLHDFRQLLLTKPRYNIKNVGSENCEYSDVAVRSKNCYYCFGIFYSEDVFYARYSRKCTSCSDLAFCVGCQWCNECVDCADCYMADFCQDCQNCNECRFCKDCFGCTQCFGCAGLHQKSHRMFNEQLTKEEYAKRMNEIDLANPEQREAIVKRMEEIRTRVPNLALHQFSCEDCTGNHLTECKGCYRCHDSFALEDCLFCIETNGNKNCCDLSICFETEWCYQTVHSPLCHSSNFLYHCDSVRDSEYCAFSRNLKHCFGCVYMENKQYHILNKPYPKEEYEREVMRIRTELQTSGRYNLLPYFCSDYERNRLKSETDSAIQTLPPSL